jgi:hypothetical protein
MRFPHSNHDLVIIFTFLIDKGDIVSPIYVHADGDTERPCTTLERVTTMQATYTVIGERATHGKNRTTYFVARDEFGSLAFFCKDARGDWKWSSRATQYGVRLSGGQVPKTVWSYLMACAV